MVELYPHQIEAVNKLRSGAILCGGVGTGKSRTALAYYEKAEADRDLYIITTARKRDTLDWEHEMEPFGTQARAVDSWNKIADYVAVKNSFFIFDEQRVVGSGVWVKSFLKIAKSNHWILLSATPGDNWMDYIPVFIANGFYKSRSEFLSRHAVYNRFSKYPKVDKWLEVGRLESYRKKIVVNMPFEKKTVQHKLQVAVDFDKDKYKTIWMDRWNPFDKKPIQDISNVCYLLRRVINEDPSRLQAIRDLLNEHDRLIVFYNFDYELEALRTLGKEVPIAEWNGHKHEPIPTKKRWVYLVQYTAGAEGWNCTKTDTVVFYSRNYSYKLMTQAAGRVDRMNTKFKDLYIYTLSSKAPIDMAIAKALSLKRSFNEKLFIGALC